MKYAIRFYQGCRILTKADEIILKYTEKSENLEHYVKKYKDAQRIIVDVTMLDDIADSIRIFKAAMLNHKNFTVMVSKNQEYIDLYEENIPFFFYEAVDNYDELNSQLKLGVTDVYIVNDLGFELHKVYNICNPKNVKIRVFPNVAQNREDDEGDPIKRFFIRPNDVDYYEKYVDVFEFFGPVDRQSVLYKIYNDKKWYGNLNEIIINFDTDIDNQTVAPCFGAIRAGCDKRCKDGRCTVCDAVISFANTLRENGLSIGKVKDEHEINAEYLSEKAERLKETFKELSGKSEL